MHDISRDFSKSNILLITHSFATGPPQELRDYLKDKAGKLLFIEHPFRYCDNTKSSMILYERGIKKREAHFLQMKGPDLLFYIKDFFLTIHYVLMTKTRFDVAIAANNLNALSALFLRRLGRVKKIIFFTIDYTPVRFQNKILNHLYHWIDRICCYRADLIWNDSALMQAAREKNGVDIRRCPSSIVVHGGNHFSRIKRLPVSGIKKDTLVYMGHVRKGQGLDLVVESLPDLIEEVPGIRFVVIGKGEYLKALEEKVERLGLTDRVSFKGYIEDLREVESVMAGCGIGLATYEPDPHSVTFYSDSGKPRIYMACGLPIIITRVSALSKDVEKLTLGVAIDYKKREFVEVVLRLLKDERFYLECRKNAISFASEFDWDVLFKNALDETLNVIL